MAAEAAKDWAERMEIRSENFEKCLETHWTDDSCGWGELLQNLWIEGPATRPAGLLLTGPEGCGRHTAAAHVVRFLRERGFDSVWLSGDDLLAEGNPSAAQKQLGALLDDFWEQDKSLCLVIEQLDGRTGRKELLSYLGRTLWDYWLAREAEWEDSRLFLILIDSGRGIPSLLREQLQRCRMTLPDLEHRRCFLENNAELTGYVSLDAFAACTEGFTYAQLMDLVRDLRMLVDLTDLPVSQEKLEQMAAEQREESSAAQSARRRAALEERLAHLMDELPSLLKNISFAGGTQAASSQEKPSTQPLKLEAMTQEALSSVTRESLEKEPVSQLVIEIFGEERAQQLIQQVQLANTNVEETVSITEMEV